MGELSEKIDTLLIQKGVSGYKMCHDLGMSRSFMTELRKGRAKSINITTAQKIASYFGVSVGYLLGTEDKEKTAPKAESGKEISDDDIKFALFGDNPEITDEMFEDVKRFARFIAEKKKD